MQNIGADNAGDAFYRYKMPKLVAKVEGRGNGIKTNVVNNVDIARALDRPPTYTLKHFGYELGAQTNFNKETGTSIVNGAHDGKALSDILEIFIKKYVQCYACGNPETVVKVRKEMITLKCKACGHTSDVDMREKLCGFIVKNPPDNKISKSEKKVKDAEDARMADAKKEARRAEKAEAKAEKEKEKEKRRKERRDSKEKKASQSADGDEADNSDDKGADDGDAAADDAAADGDGDDDDDGTEWKTDMSEAAVARRAQQQLTAAAASLVQGPPVDSAGDNGTNANGAAHGASGNGSASATGSADNESDDADLEPIDAVRNYLAKSRAPLRLWDLLSDLPIEGKEVGKMKLFYSALLGEKPGRVLERMEARDKYILSLKRDDKAQAAQLIALEHYLTQVEPERMGEMPHVLKWLYEEDLIDEDIIVAWGDAPAIARKHGVDSGAAKAVRELSQKVLDWLQEESSDDEE